VTENSKLLYSRKCLDLALKAMFTQSYIFHTLTPNTHQVVVVTSFSQFEILFAITHHYPFDQPYPLQEIELSVDSCLVGLAAQCMAGRDNRGRGERALGSVEHNEHSLAVFGPAQFMEIQLLETSFEHAPIVATWLQLCQPR
jgi:hypothetical protein